MPDKIKFPVQIICSTQNQMVNYIPVMQFCAENIINLTLAEDDQNERWDKALKDSIFFNQKIRDISLPRDILLSHEKLKEKIQEELDKLKVDIRKLSCLWNITGGQRYFTLAMFDLFKDTPGNFLCYLEGNSNEIFVLKNDTGVPEKCFATSCSANLKDDLTVEKALQLMSFTIQGRYDYRRNFVNGKFEGINIDNYLGMFEQLKADEAFRKDCFRANSNYEKNVDFSKYTDNDGIKSEFSNGFGKPFEKMVAAKLEKIIMDNKLPVNEMIGSQEINFSNNPNGNYPIDEFDIILVTANGKVMIFELKTGKMSGDVAKSTKYSTYAVGGVYGKPILIVPLTAAERKDPKKINTLVGNENTYKTLLSTINAAKRANLEIWGIDELENKLNSK